MLSAAQRAGGRWPVVGLVLALFLASVGTVQEYAGTISVVAYLVLLAGAVPVVLDRLVPRVVRSLSPRSAILLAVCTLGALIVAFAVVYPIANAGEHFGGGSDRDDDVNVATRRLLDLDYPYHARTYLDNPISHLPGSYLLAVPFVLLGNGAYQNFFWLAALFVYLAWYLRDARLALVLLWIVLLAAPGVMRELLTGGDLISNNIYVLLASMGFLAAARRTTRLSTTRVATACALGLALSSRANFLFVLPFLFFALARTEGWRTASRDLTVVAVAFLAVTLPFYLYDPGGFSALDAEAKLRQYNVVLPGAEAILLTAGGALALWLAVASRADDLTVLRNTAVVQAFFVVSSIVLASVALHTVSFGVSRVGYGLNVLFFAAVAAWGSWARGVGLAGARAGSGGDAGPARGSLGGLRRHRLRRRSRPLGRA
jgi:hypothetical protein